MTDDWKGQYEKRRIEIGLDAGGSDEASARPSAAVRQSEPDTKIKETQAKALIRLASDAALFHTPDGEAYADIEINGRRQTYNIRKNGFRRLLSARFFGETGGPPSPHALRSAQGLIEAWAHHESPQREVYRRVGECDGSIFIDLCDGTWRAIEISPGGWRLVANPPVRFRRAPGMKLLPEPQRGGTIDDLRPFLNTAHEDEFILIVAWILQAYRGRGPYPVLLVSGEQGSAKSTACALMRSLIDPNAAPLRALPREDRDLFITADNSHVLVFDNVSGMQPWQSDSLCRIATGGGFSSRQLYSDDDEKLFEAARPIILNGIDSVITRADLADRSLFITFDPIPDRARKLENELWADFERARPRIMGALFEACARGLREFPLTRLDGFPRMADFAKWAMACEAALWPAGTFACAYRNNLADIVSDVLDADPVATALQQYVLEKKGEPPTQTASALLGALTEIVSNQVSKSKGWPATPKTLSDKLRRAAPFLRKQGINIEWRREGKASTRIIRIYTDLDWDGKLASASSASSAIGNEEGF